MHAVVMHQEVAMPRRSVRAEAVARGPVRLTARGRAVFLAGVLGGSLVTGMTLTEGSSSAAGNVPPPRQYEHVVVQPGQTLWEIARTFAPGADPRVTIERIRDLNAMPNSDVRAGERIALP